MTSPYVYERQSEYWTSRQVEEFLFDAGFQVITFPLSQHHENSVPADFLFFQENSCKLFGLQYKALYKNGGDFWPIDHTQHDRLRKYPWIYYCLSELRSPSDFRSALHYTRILKSTSFSEDKLYPKGGKFPFYSRWGRFFQGLEQCKNGVLVLSPEKLRSILQPDDKPDFPFELVETLIDVFLVDFKTRHSVHFSPRLRESQ